MLSALIIFAVFSVFLALFYRTRFASVISIYLFGCILMIFAGISYYIAISIYRSVSGIDYILISLITKTHPDIYKSALIHNIGVCTIMAGAISVYTLTHKPKLSVIISMLVPIMGFFILFNPSVSWCLFLNLKSSDINSGVSLVYWLRRYYVVICAIYLVLPIVFFGQYMFKTKIYVKKRYGISCILCMAFVYSVIYLLFINGAFRPTMFYNIDLMGFPCEKLGIYSENMSILLSIMIIVTVNVFVIFCFSPFKKFRGLNRKLVKNTQKINENIYLLLHAYKNKFLCIEKFAALGEKIQDTSNIEDILSIFRQIDKEAGEAVENISRTLHMINSVKMEYHIFSVENCVEEAMHKIGLTDISFEKCYNHTLKSVILGNKKQIVECFLNIFQNSIEAIEQKKEIDKDINVYLYAEEDMVLIVFSDNGCGIKRKHIKNIFKPFFTTKDKKVGNGLGLDFVNRVINAHGGSVRVKSTEGVGTKVMVVLPLYVRNKKLSSSANVIGGKLI